MAGKSTTLVIRILADAAQAAKTLKGFKGASVAAAGVAGGVAAGFLAMGKAAAEDAHGQALLAKSLQNTAGATSAQIAATEDWISKTTLATGVADDQLRPALSTLARATGDVTTAQSAMATVLDVAAATGKDTESVAAAVAKAYAGNTTALGKMVPGMDKAILKSGDMTKIMGELARMTGGSAAVAADTATGKWQRAQVAFAEAKESIGGALLPVLDKAGSSLARFGTFAANNAGTVQTLALVLAGLAATVMVTNAAVKVYTTYTTIAGYVTKTLAGETMLATVATKLYAAGQRAAAIAANIWATAQWALNVAMDANPIGAVIIVVMLLVAAFILAYKKSATFRAIVAAAWSGIKAAASATWSWLKTKVFAPLAAAYRAASAAAGTAAGLIAAAWNGLKSAMASVWHWLQSNVFGPLKSAFDAVVGAVQKVIDWIGKIKIPGPVQKLIDLGKSVFMVPPGGVAVAPAPTVGARRTTAATRAAGVEAGAGGVRDPLAGLTTPEVIVQVSDRKMAQLVDVSIRASATSAARNLTRRRVVTV